MSKITPEPPDDNGDKEEIIAMLCQLLDIRQKLDRRGVRKRIVSLKSQLLDILHESDIRSIHESDIRDIHESDIRVRLESVTRGILESDIRGILESDIRGILERIALLEKAMNHFITNTNVSATKTRFLRGIVASVVIAIVIYLLKLVADHYSPAFLT